MRSSIYVLLLLLGLFQADRSLVAQHARQATERPLPATAATTDVPQQLQRNAGALTHLVHGYHPYWISDTAADSYRWDLLTHLAYFSYEVDPSTGEAVTVRDWRTSTVIDRAKAAGVKVLLTVTNFGAEANRTLLSSPQARDLLVTRLISLLQERGGHGVNIDFESLSGDQRGNLVSFFVELRMRLDAARDAGSIPDAVITVAAPAVDWNGAWDVAAIAPSIDLLFVMCYDYSWSGSANAGPVAPLRGMNYNVERTLRWYLDAGAPASKLLMGVPYYGYDWPVTSEAPGSAATGRATARTYSVAAAMLPARTRHWSETYFNPWITYQTAGWQQLWYDDTESLEHKYGLVKDLGIAGMGMWALGYDADLPELWNLIERMFTRPASVAVPPAAGAFALWPQPLQAGDVATLQPPSDGPVTHTERSVTVFDLLGRHAAEIPLLDISDNRIRFIAPDLPSGMYVFSVGRLRGRLIITAR